MIISNILKLFLKLAIIKKKLFIVCSTKVRNSDKNKFYVFLGRNSG